MDILEAIFSRQSVSKVSSEPLPHDLIEKLLSAAVQAPNHHKVRPWRFVVLTGEGRRRLGDAMADALRQRDLAVLGEAVEVERARPLRAPVIIAVGVDKPQDPKVIETENICAAAAAVENMLLAARGLGLAAMWRTGKAAYEPGVKEFLGFTPDQNLIAFVYVGYPEFEKPPAQRPSFEDRTTWLE